MCRRAPVGWLAKASEPGPWERRSFELGLADVVSAQRTVMCAPALEPTMQADALAVAVGWRVTKPPKRSRLDTAWPLVGVGLRGTDDDGAPFEGWPQVQGGALRWYCVEAATPPANPVGALTWSHVPPGEYGHGGLWWSVRVVPLPWATGAEAAPGCQALGTGPLKPFIRFVAIPQSGLEGTWVVHVRPIRRADYRGGGGDAVLKAPWAWPAA